MRAMAIHGNYGRNYCMNLCFRLTRVLNRGSAISLRVFNQFHGLYNSYKSGKVIKSSNRVQRGGSWNNNTNNCQSWNRNNNNPNNSNNNIGFRLVNTLLAGIEQSDLFKCAFMSPDLFILPVGGEEKRVSGVSKQ